MPLKLVNVQQIGNELALKWNDKAESYIELERLRRACPCAACGGEPDVMGRIQRPLVTYSARSFLLENFSPVGAYALQFRWSDGHATGIYSFAYLRKLAGSG